MHTGREGMSAMPYFDDFDLSTVDILLISQYVALPSSPRVQSSVFAIAFTRRHPVGALLRLQRRDPKKKGLRAAAGYMPVAMFVFVAHSIHSFQPSKSSSALYWRIFYSNLERIHPYRSSLLTHILMSDCTVSILIMQPPCHTSLQRPTLKAGYS